jgi:L-fucose mutarotase
MDADAKEAGLKIPVHDDFKAIVATFDARGANAVGHLERHAFYEKADGCCVIVQTGERAGYANIIVQKGVVK